MINPPTGGSYLCITQVQDETFGLECKYDICYFNERTQKFYKDSQIINVIHWTPLKPIKETMGQIMNNVNMGVPAFHSQNYYEAYLKMLELVNILPNDQELGRETRKFINDVQENVFSQTIEDYLTK